MENAVNFSLNNAGSLGSEFVENDGDVDKDGNVVFVDDSSWIGFSEPQYGEQGWIFWKLIALVLTVTRRESRMTIFAGVMDTILGGVMTDTVPDLDDLDHIY